MEKPEEILEEQAPGTAPEETEEELFQRLESEIRAEMEKEADRRVTQALKKLERTHKREKAQADEEKRQKEEEEHKIRLAEFAEQERKLALKAIRLDLVDILSANNIPGGFRGLIPCEDLVDSEPDPVKRYMALKDRVKDIWTEFNKEVKKAVEAERAKLIR